MNNINKSNAVLLFLLGIPFAVVGVLFFSLSIIPTINEYYTMRAWQPVQATVTSAELVITHGKKNSISYRATGTYSYEYLGKSYKGDRISISSGGDNVGSFQQDRSKELNYAQNAHSTILIYVNPKQPSESIYNRDIRISLFAIKLACAILFGLFGFSMIVMAFYNKKSKQLLPIVGLKNPLSSSDAPKSWASATQTENGRTKAISSWFFTIFWCLICFTITFSSLPINASIGILPAIILWLFNGIGVWLIFKAIYATISWKKFGDVSLTLSPFPGEIGGRVAGVIDAPLLAGGAVLFTVDLSCLHTQVSGSGKHRRTSTTTKWCATNQCKGYLVKNNNRITISFAFNVPSGLPDAQPQSNEYNHWWIKVSAPLDGVDFDRSWEIPVFTKSSF